MRANAYAASGQSKLALTDHNRTLKLSAKTLQAYVNRGRVYRKLRNYHQALRDYNQALSPTPAAPRKPDVQLARLHNDRAVVLGLMGRRGQAIAELNGAIDLYPGYAVAYNNRAVIFIRLKRWEKTDADTATAIKLSANDNTTWAAALKNRGMTPWG